MTTPQTLQLTATTGLPGETSADTIGTYSGTLEEASQKLAIDLLNTATEQGWLTITCDPPPTAEQREAITRIVAAAFDTAEWETPQDGWEGERVSIDPRFQPGFARQTEEYEEDYVVALWYSNDTLVLLTFDICDTPESTTSIKISHWHPASRCSGSWGDTLGIITDNLSFVHRRNDDDGYYISFQATDLTTPAHTAHAIDAFVKGTDLSGAERRLLQAYFLGFEGGDTSLLEGENSGYEVSSLTITATPDVIDELHELNTAPSQQDAAEWLAWLANHENDLHENNLLDNNAEHPLVVRLRQIAGQPVTQEDAQ